MCPPAVVPAAPTISLVSRKWSIFNEMQMFYLQIINNRPFSTAYILCDGYIWALLTNVVVAESQFLVFFCCVFFSLPTIPILNINSA